MGKPANTANDHEFFEASSAFQKAIRRGDEDAAMHWMIELYEFNRNPKPSRYDEYLWKRIRIIVSEDIGLAEPNLPAVIEALYLCYKDQKKKDIANGGKHGAQRLQLTHAVLLLVRAKKSRLVDNALGTYWDRWKGNGHEMKIPDYALDKHTQKGKSMGRGYEHFFTEGVKLENEDILDRDDEYKEGRESAYIHPQTRPKKDNSEFKMTLD